MYSTSKNTVDLMFDMAYNKFTIKYKLKFWGFISMFY